MQRARSWRGAQIDEIAEALPTRAAMLSRLFLGQSTLRVSRTDVGVLQALAEGPCRITVLAAREGVTQPAITVLVNRMVARGWVRRDADPLDGRVVLVALTAQGREVWERLRREYRALLHEEMASLPDVDVDVLARATEILDYLIDRLRDQARPTTRQSPPGAGAERLR
ncbi:MAG: MarR family winged helix-turn-helix transcriptional regulator [Solirubrobacteraceae bacterium]